MAKLTVRDLDVRGKRVFLRVDYNVPLEEKDGQMVITDDTRIVATLPTLKLLMEKGGKLILTAHLGRPKGKRDVTMSLKPVAAKLSELLGKPVTFVDDCIGEKVEQAVAAMKDGDVVLLENVRYYNEEEKNDPAFAEKLAKVADVYVNDAFGAAHRAHASTEGVARVVAKRGGKCAAGLLMERELKFLGDELDKPARPFVVILGGAKVSDKIKVIDRLLEKANTILIGGAMAYTFRLAQGYKTGKSLVESGRDRHRQGRARKGQDKKCEISFAGGRRGCRAGQDRQARQEGQTGHRMAESAHEHGHELPGRRGGAGYRDRHGRGVFGGDCESEDDFVERPDGVV